MLQLSRIAPLLVAAALAVNIQAQDQETTFRADARLVVLHASVVDKSGKLRLKSGVPGSDEDGAAV